MILQVICKKCGQVVNIEHEPNEFISEDFIRNAFVCDDCNHSRTAKRKLIGDAPKPEASLPYKDL